MSSNAETVTVFVDDETRLILDRFRDVMDEQMAAAVAGADLTNRSDLRRTEARVIEAVDELPAQLNRALEQRFVQLASQVTALNAELATVKAEAGALREQLAAMTAAMTQSETALTQIAAGISESAAVRDSLSGVPGLVVWLLGERLTLKLLGRRGGAK